ncbi:MAG: hypothetical protein ACP5NY_04135 [Thermocladium sp.]
MWRDWALATFRFSIALSIIDLLVVIVLIGAGVNVPQQLYFAPKIAGQSFLSAINSYKAASSSNNIGIQVIFFFFYVVPSGLFFALTNLIFGVLAGFPLAVWDMANLLNAPMPDAVAFLALSIIMQSLTWVYVIDSLIGWLFIGRTMHGEAGE